MENRHLSAEPGHTEVLQQVLSTLQSLQKIHDGLVASVKLVEDRMIALTNLRQEGDRVSQPSRSIDREQDRFLSSDTDPLLKPVQLASSTQPPFGNNLIESSIKERELPGIPSNGATNSKIILTTYPHQSGIDPIKMIWGDADPLRRGPVVVSRAPRTIRRRNGKQKVFRDL
jgi:hypothetical protein